ncbi:MAG: hypothetical protein JWM73_1328, partial [Solirubrobacterales bacterium]|nr:hypothetical protein [Solirubrobacterales bacterium]
PAGAAITYVNQNSASTTTATLTITKPTSTTTSDVLVATVSGAGTNTITAPAGWTLLVSTASPGATMRTLTYFKVATASEGASYAFTSSAARNMTGGIIALRGANPDFPIDAVGEASGASGNAVAPAVTTSAANDWVINAGAVARNATFTAAAGTTARYSLAGTGTSSHGATATQVAAGATTARSMVPSNTTANWIAHTIAVRDATTAGLSVALGATTRTFTSNLDDGDSAEPWTLDATVNDTRTSSSAGWQLQITSTTLTTGTRSLATTATGVSGVSAVACDAGAPCTLPTNAIAFPVDVPAATTAPAAVKFYNAAANTGESRVDLTIGFTALVPQNAYAGSYSSTVTISVVSGP